MSDTEINELPPMNVFHANSQGLYAWNATFRSLTVGFVLGDVRLGFVDGDQAEIVSMTPAEADHIANLLQKAAQQARANLGGDQSCGADGSG